MSRIENIQDFERSVKEMADCIKHFGADADQALKNIESLMSKESLNQAKEIQNITGCDLITAIKIPQETPYTFEEAKDLIYSGFSIKDLYSGKDLLHQNSAIANLKRALDKFDKDQKAKSDLMKVLIISSSICAAIGLSLLIIQTFLNTHQ